jgi:cyclase
MTAPMTRRAFVERAAAAAAAAALPLRASRAQAPALEVTDLGRGLALIAGAGANVTLLDTGERLVLVDAGRAERTAALLALLAQRWPGRSVQAVFNTNWGEEHTGANARLNAAGAESLAHENTKLWMGAEFAIEWSGRTHERVAPAALPTRTFYQGGTLPAGDTSVAYGYLPRAHTDGDVYVHLPEHDVLVVSDLLAVGGYPAVDWVTGGWIGGMRDATKALLEIAGPATRIVAADGSPHGRAALEGQLALCETALKAVANCYRAGGSLEDFLASAPVADFEDERGDAREFLALVYEGAWGHVRELGGTI